MPSLTHWLRDLFSSPIDLSSADGFQLAAERLAQRADGRIFTQLNALKAARQRQRSVDYLRALHFIRLNQAPSAVEALKEELRYFPEHEEARALLSRIAPVPAAPAGDSEFDRLLTAVRPWTMLGTERLRSLYDLAVAVCDEDLPGNFVECGVAAGGSSALLAAVIQQHSKRPRKHFACDTFAGMPEPTAADTHEGLKAEATGWGTGTCAAPRDSLFEVCGSLGVTDLVEPVQGLFEETLPARRSEFGPVALLHMDGDWFSSTMAILENLFDSVVPGGKIQIDDYGYWEGCRKAVDEFTARRGLRFKLNKIDATGVWLVKETQ